MTDREALAYHEAGHAVAHVLADYPFTYVTIETNEKYEGHIKPSGGPSFMLREIICSRKRETVGLIRSMVICLHAGNVAEEIFLGHHAEIESWTDTEEIEEIAKYRSKHPKRWAQHLRRQTRHILMSPEIWENVATVAAALLEKQTLTSEEVHALLKRDYTWGDYCQSIDKTFRAAISEFKLAFPDADV